VGPVPTDAQLTALIEKVVGTGGKAPTTDAEMRAAVTKAMDNIESIQKLVKEFEPELKALGERTDDLDSRIKAIEEVLQEGGMDIGKKKTTLHASITARHGLLSNLDATADADADADELELDYDDFGVGSFKLIVDHQDQDLQARVSYWEDTNNNPFHGRGANLQGIDEAWIKTSGWGGKWTIGNQYAGGHNAALMGGAVDAHGLLYYAPAAGLGIQYETELGGLDLLGFIGSNGPAAAAQPKTDGQAVVRAGLDLGGNIDLSATYLATGMMEQKGWSADVGLKLLSRQVNVSYAQLTETAAGASLDDDNTVWMVGVPKLIDSGALSIGASYGEVEAAYAANGTSVLTTPYLLNPLENAFDRPVFLDPANVAKGWEVNAQVKLLSVPLKIRYYDGDNLAGNDANSVTTVSLTKKLSPVANLELLYGVQEDGAGVGTDLSVARAQVSLGF